MIGSLLALVAVGVAVGAHSASRTALRTAKACGATVKVTDHEKFVVNQYLQDAMRFAPGTATVKSGCDLTFEFATSDQDDPHSLSIVKESDLPKTTAEMESCKVCKLIKPEHVGDPTDAGRAEEPDPPLDRQRRQDGARRPGRQPRDLREPGERGAAGPRKHHRPRLGSAQHDPLLHVRAAPLDAGQDPRHVSAAPAS